ncbi:M16 family metallopeptidase [Pantanalinema rosaneae CENA516]|uniref:M16 family metallopeptidase n=1 Tax=Pantanalinema rosaneae TaxID=1620701 RepID=UPI003D6F5516
MQKLTNRGQRTKIITLVFCFLVVPVLLLFLALIQPAAAATPKHYTELTFPPLPEITIPDYTRFQLANGMVVYLMEDHEFPLVGGTALIRTGDRFEPAERVGLAELTGTVMRSGGTETYPAAQLNQLLEQKAASVETGISEAAGSAGFSALSEDLESVFGLFAEVLQKPAFAADQLAVAKTQVRGGIARRNDDPNSITSREFTKLIYGADSPYARITEYATIDPIAREDLINFYRQYYSPDRMILGIVGDFNPQTMRRLIEQKFGNWQPDKPSANLTIPTATQVNQGGIFLVDQPQLTQSNIRMGHLGGLLNSPDYPALTVMNEVLNGFGGRLFNEVRSRQGLAYSVYGLWSPRYDYPGLFVAGGQTRSEATVPFIKSVMLELAKIRTAPVSDTELKVAKDSVLNSFIFNFQEPSQTLSRLLTYEYYGYPKDFLFQYQQGVEATTIADVQRVANKYLKPENIVTLVVGNAKAIQPPLSSISPNGKVTAIDVTIPAPQQS